MDNIEEIYRAYEISRKEMVDIGLRGNTLLHFKAGTKSIEIIDEQSSEVYQILVTDQKTMSFAPLMKEAMEVKEANEYHDDDNGIHLPQLFEESNGANRFTDSVLQTNLISDKLDRKLLKISTEALSYEQETGIEILYLVLGFLEWFEDVNSSIPRNAPLVLVPVRLIRSRAGESFKIEYTQADIGINLTLEAKMKHDFGIQIPEIDEELDIDLYFHKTKNVIAKYENWMVHENTISLGFFSFGKFRMYQDLDQENWPDGKKPLDHPVVKGLITPGSIYKKADFPFDTADFHAAARELPDVTKVHYVKDADSSQTAAINAVRNGVNLVIQGPPGTGKSQTITNIISESIAENKKVLFVAEKMAALEVVKKRLDECNLGAAVLELHSHKSNKRTVLEELKRTLELGPPEVKERVIEKEQYRDAKKRLDSYCLKVNTVIRNSGFTYVDALGHYMHIMKEVGNLPAPDFDFTPIRDWDKKSFYEGCSIIENMVAVLKEMGVSPKAHPFSAFKRETISPMEQESVTEKIERSINTITQLKRASLLEGQYLILPEPQTLSDVKKIYFSLKLIDAVPNALSNLDIHSEIWIHQQEKILSLLSCGSQIFEIRKQYDSIFLSHAWKADLVSIRQYYQKKKLSIQYFFSSRLRNAKYFLQSLLNVEVPRNHRECLALIDTVLLYQELEAKYHKTADLGRKLFGSYWQDNESDWEFLKELNEWAAAIHQETHKNLLPVQFFEVVKNKNNLTPKSLDSSADALLRLLKSSQKQINDLYDYFGYDADSIVTSETIKTFLDTLKFWKSRIHDIYQIVRFNQVSKSLNGAGLFEIASLSYTWEYPPELLLKTFLRSWYGGLVNEAYSKHKEINQFDRATHEQTIERFKKIDSALLHFAQEELVKKHYEDLPVVNAAGEMAILNHEMNKKRRHKPIRTLLLEAGHAVQTIKPVFMMSPMSIATYLQQGGIDFDLVIFDEASQIKVVEALGAILRGKQVVVVGDTRQMPPTDFFSKTMELDDEEAEDNATADIESILSMFLSKGAPQSMLRWHYRSHHDSLIAVSNREFYENKLMIFPSPGVNPIAAGLKFHHTAGSVYERGSSRTNPLEARIVAGAVMQQAKETPDLTVGVVAFSTAQRDRILLELEVLRRQDPSLEHYFNSGKLESFFVKNLENVQGDERDIIFISVGYGKTEAGSVPKNFGPVNRDGGERRLNVLITRSRLSMVVFCNFTAEDLDVQSSSPFGVRALKSFLYYAEKGKFEHYTATGRDTDSPFEDEVIAAIKQLGYSVEPQLGSAGFYIDIAVKDPEKPGRFILAVECDGASYHSSATARDRDRLRQSVLEELGWKFHRIWSTDWFRNRNKEIERLEKAIHDSIRYYTAFSEPGERTVKSGTSAYMVDKRPIQRKAVKKQKVFAAPLYKLFNGKLHISSMDIEVENHKKIAAALKKILDTEGPLPLDEAAKRVVNALGYSRMGSRISRIIYDSAEFGHKGSIFFLAKDFLYHDAEKKVTVRNRSELPASLKKIELVPPEELQEALLTAIAVSYRLKADKAIAEALSLIGFNRVTTAAKDSVQQALDKLIDIQIVVVDEALCSIADNEMAERYRKYC